MGFPLPGRTLEHVGVVGAGHIGPDIALHLARALGPSGVRVILVDVAEAALEAARRRIEDTLERAVQARKARPAEAQAAREALAYAGDVQALAGAALVVEAATEDLDLKRRLFGELERVVAPDGLILSNTSHYEPERLFEHLDRPGRALVAHYFYPADRNPVVELVAGRRTDPSAVDLAEQLYERTDKWPVRVRGRHGFAVNPIFEGVFLASVLLVDEGVADCRQVDAVAREDLGYGVGPFTAMNLVGGNPLVVGGLEAAAGFIGPWFHVPRRLTEAIASGAPWPTARRDEPVAVPDAVRERVRDALRAVLFALTVEAVEHAVIDLGDLELALGAALDVRPPFAEMNRLGVARSLALVEAYAALHPGFPVPPRLRRQAEAGAPWSIPVVHRRDRDGVAVLQIRRPAALNALNAAVFDQLEAHLRDVARDPAVVGAVLTGFGPRAFVSGADIKELVAIATPAELAAKSRRGQSVIDLCDGLGKPVVAAMNGLAFGGGLELAMGCTARIARAGQAVFVGQPEPKLGVIPGYGGTQRLPRIVGLAEAWPLLRLGEPISSARALAIGLIQAEVPAEALLHEAIALCRRLATGEERARPLPRGPIPVPEDLPELPLGHLSRAIDAIQTEVVLAGARTSLEEGLRLEAEAFGRCHATEDYHLGMGHFVTHGPRTPAPFVHR